jgi:hypothetical protein
MRLLTTVLLALATAGCGVYLHHPGNQATADGALKDFQSFREKSGNPYAVMLKNHEKAKAATADAQRAAAERRVTGFALAMPHTTWEGLRTKLDAEADALKAATDHVDQETRALLDTVKEAKAAQGTAADKLKAAKAAVAKQFNDNQRWVAQQALFKSAIQKIAETSTSTKSDLGPKEALGTASQLLGEKVSVQQQDKDGKVQVVEKTIGDVLGVSLPKDVKDFPDLVKQLSGVTLTPATPPGISVTILGLAADLADAEYRREQIRLAILQRRVDVLDALHKNVAAASDLVGQARNGLRPMNRDQLKEPIVTSLGTFRSSERELAPRFQTLAAAAIPLTTLASERLRMEVELASLEHEASIRVSAVNAQAHEALIGRGLEGLAAYHRGGVTPEEIANVIRAAQAVALGVIGGRI